MAPDCISASPVNHCASSALVVNERRSFPSPGVLYWMAGSGKRAATAALYTDPTIRPGNVTASSPDNTFIGVTTPGPAYSSNYTGQYLGCYVKKVGSVYTVYFGTGDLSYYTTAFPNDLYINPVGPIGGTTFVGGGGDFSSSLFVNESNGYAYIELSSVFNPTLQAWLDASIKP